VKVSLSFEKGYSKDLSIMVDALRASTTITIALDKFKEIYPVYTPEEAIEIAQKKNAALAGERTGRTIEGFELGNSPGEMKDYDGEKDSLVLTTTNGVRVLENMDAEIILIGSFINAKACAKAACELATEHIELVMGGFERTFAIEDFLAAGEIMYWIQEELGKQNKLDIDDVDYFKEETGITEYALSAILASRNGELLEKNSIKSKSGRRLSYLGYEDDVKLCVQRNISENVGIYKDGKITLY
jgi:2-phosphosulfolactate phosphatase